MGQANPLPPVLITAAETHSARPTQAATAQALGSATLHLRALRSRRFVTTLVEHPINAGAPRRSNAPPRPGLSHEDVRIAYRLTPGAQAVGIEFVYIARSSGTSPTPMVQAFLETWAGVSIDGPGCRWRLEDGTLRESNIEGEGDAGLAGLAAGAPLRSPEERRASTGLVPIENPGPSITGPRPLNIGTASGDVVVRMTAADARILGVTIWELWQGQVE